MHRMSTSASSARRVQRRRDKLRAAGLRPVQIWVPDVRRQGFADECARQARLIRDSETAESYATPQPRSQKHRSTDF
jgi:hypothetical protein